MNVPETNSPCQSEKRSFLVAAGVDLRKELACCPAAKTFTGISTVLDELVLIATECGRWSCPNCGRKKVAPYAQRVRAAEPSRLITLTVNPAIWKEPREAFDGTRRKVTDFAKFFRRKGAEFEFFRILEVTKKGWPHYHLVTRCPYIPHADLSRKWADLTKAPIVDVRQIKKVGDVYFYVIKYLAKQAYIPWTERRATWSRNFFAEDDFKPGQKLEIMCPEFDQLHPADWLRWHVDGRRLIEYSPTCWIIQTTKNDPSKEHWSGH